MNLSIVEEILKHFMRCFQIYTSLENFAIAKAMSQFSALPNSKILILKYRITFSTILTWSIFI